MKNDTRRTRLDLGPLSWLKALALAVTIMLGACVIADSDDYSTSMVMCFDENGFTFMMRLESPVGLPIDKDDAYYIMESSGCPCQGRLYLVGDYWQHPEDPGPGDCMVRINVYTGDVDCFSG